MAIDKEWLEDRWEIMPEGRISQVTLYPRLPDSQLDTEHPITVGAADKRECEFSAQQLAEVDIEVETTTFHLYVSTFSPSLQSSQRSLKDWIVVDAGNQRWKIMRSRLIQMETRYHVDCIEMFGKPG